MGVLSCSRVIMRTALALVVLLAVTVSGGRHHKNRNKGNKGEGRARCGVQQYTVQEKTYKQECHNEYENRCATSYANKCSTVTVVTTEYENVCSTSYVDKCSTVTEVTTKYENVCSTSYVESCATVTEVTKECHTASLHSTHSYGHAGHGSGQEMRRGPCPQQGVHQGACRELQKGAQRGPCLQGGLHQEACPELLPGAHQGLQECGCERAQDCGQASLHTLRSEQRHDQVCKIFLEQIYFFLRTL